MLLLYFLLLLLRDTLLLTHGALVPRPWDFYAGGEPEPGQMSNIRHFRHSENHEFDDGSDLSVNWDVDTDPETLLEMDLEQHNGVRILDCGPDHLTIKVNKALLERLDRIEHVTASDFLHGCSHLQDNNLYHRIEKIHKVTPLGHGLGALVKFGTKELKTAQEVFSHCRVSLRVMPSGAKEPEELQRNLLSRRSGRRLDLMDFMKKSISGIGEAHGGKMNFKAGVTADDQNTKQAGSFFNLNSPNEKDKFHWNWNYKANSTQNPQYKYTLPGGTMWLRLFKPFVDSTVGFSMNISSHMPGFMQTPHVVVESLVQTVTAMDLDVGMAADFDKDKSASVLNNVLDQFDIPILSKIKADSENFMKPMIFHIGGTPVRVTPGWSVNMKIFHIGRMKGTMRVGLKTKLLAKGHMHFDTSIGERHNFSAKMLNVSFTPPTWMLFTQAFQLGVELAPSVWVKGGFGSMQDMEMGFGLRPYFNVSVEQGDGASASSVTDLAIYPYLASGLPVGKSYSIKITANGQFKTTAMQMSTGVVEFQNKVANFDFGPMDKDTLLKTPIQVAILENGPNGQETQVGTGQVMCTAVVDGFCNPSPTQAKVNVGGQDVLVYLGIAFQASALSMLESQMQTISLRFPMLTLNSQAQGIFKLMSDPKNLASAKLRLYHNGHTYIGALKPKFNNAVQLLESDAIWELGSSFMESWTIQAPAFAGPNGTSSSAARLASILQLLVQDKVVASGTVPAVQISGSGSVSSLEELDSQQDKMIQPMPIQVELMAQQGSGSSELVGNAQIELDIMPASYGSFWVQPFQADTFVAGTPYTFAWTTHGAEPNSYYSFNISLMEVAENGLLATPAWEKALEVKCTQDPDVAVHRYLGSGTPPCVFEYQITAPASLAGKTAVALCSWSDAMNLPHYMASPPFFYGAGGRRLQGQAPSPPGAGSVTAEQAAVTTAALTTAPAAAAPTELPATSAAPPPVTQPPTTLAATTTEATVIDSADLVEQNDESVGFRVESMGHKEGLSANAQQALQDLKSHCTAAPLKYSAGAGVNYVQLMKHLMIPGAGSAMSMMSGNMNAAGAGSFNPNGDYVSKPYPIWRLGEAQNGKLSDLLPKSVCVGGVCKGMMPGCQSTKVNPIDIPRIVYKFSRTFNWIDHVGATPRHVIAYGLMLLPSALKEGAREASSAINNTALASADTNVNAQPFDFGNMLNRRLHDTHDDESPQAGGKLTVEEIDDMGDDWSVRRPMDEMVVEISHPIHYQITEPLMRYLLATDAFRGLEDGQESTHGPVHVVDFEILDSPRVAAAKLHAQARASNDAIAKQRAPVPVQHTGSVSDLWEAGPLSVEEGRDALPKSLLNLSAVSAVLFLTALAALASARRSGYVAVTRTESLSPLGAV